MKKSDRDLMAEKAIRFIQKDLAQEYRYLTPAFYYLTLIPDPEEKYMSTDSRHLFYNTEYILGDFMGKQKEYRVLKYRYLHIVVHCLAGHMKKRDETDRTLFDSCADLYAVLLMKKLTGKTPAIPRDYRRLFSSLKKETERRSFFQFLWWCRKDQQRSLNMIRLGRILRSDSHDNWFEKNPLAEQMDREENGIGTAGKDWEYMRDHLSQMAGLTGAGSDRMWGNRRGDMQMQVTASDGEDLSYERIIREICRISEVYDSDLEFDPLWYSAGMEIYGNRPFIEPSECTEQQTVRDLVVAIDTSGSCENYASSFLGLTMHLLKQAGTWKGTVWIVQCDTEIRDAKALEQADETVQLESQVMYGWGGTDFTPVFRFIRDKREAGEMDKPSALIYFSDGYGDFPDSEPDYKTVFVFPPEEGVYACNDWIPDWVLRYKLAEDELKKSDELVNEKEEKLWNI